MYKTNLNTDSKVHFKIVCIQRKIQVFSIHLFDLRTRLYISALPILKNFENRNVTKEEEESTYGSLGTKEVKIVIVNYKFFHF